MADTQEVTAVRTTRPNGEQTITVTLPTGQTVKAGGNRAKRATAVIVAQYADGRWNVECRADAAAAQAEADRKAQPFTQRHAGHVFQCEGRKFSAAIMVVDQ